MHRLLLILVAAAVVVVTRPPHAAAHAFLAQTDPVQGARLASSPDELVFRFSEPVAGGSFQVELRRYGEEPVAIGRPRFEEGARLVRVPLPPLDDGVYVFSAHAVSAVDGHETASETAFAVGDVDAALPAARSSGTGADWEGIVAGWLFFVGTAAAGGALVAQVLSLPGLGAAARRRWIRVGLLVALVGGAARLSVLDPVTGQEEVLLVLLALVAALLAVGLVSSPWPSLTATASAWPAWSAMGHAAGTGVAGLVLDTAHLAAGALWLGALSQVVVAVWRTRGEGWLAMRDAAMRYARFGLVLLALLAAAGTLSAFRLVPSWRHLWTTGYGIVLVSKILLLGAAALLALAARTRGLKRGRLSTARLVTAESGALVVAVALAAVLAQLTPPRPAPAAGSLLGPPPMEGPVARAAGLAGSLSLDISAGDGRLDILVISSSGPIEGAAIAVDAVLPGGRTAELRPRPCGAGCFTQALRLPSGDTALEIDASAPGWHGGRFEATLSWPPRPERPELFEAMVEAMRAVPRVWVSEVVSSDGPPRRPDDRGGVEMSGEQFVSLMPWAGGGVVDVHPMAAGSSRFSFYLPGSRMFVEVTTDPMGRLVEQRLVNPGHEIWTVFRYAES